MSATAGPIVRQPATRASSAAYAVLMLMGVCTFLNLYPAQSLLPLFEQVFHATKAQVGWTISATTCAVALASPLAGWVVDRLDRRRVIITAFLAIALSTAAASTAGSLDTLIAWRFVQGLFIPGAYVAAIALIGEAFGAGKTGSAMATYITGNVLGGFLGRMLAGLLAAHGGWREAFLVLGALDLIGALAAWGWLSHLAPEDVRRGNPAALRELPRLLVARPLVPIYVVGFVMLFTLVALFTYVDFHLAAAPFNLGPAELGCVFMVYLLGMVVTPAAGRWIDRFGFREVGALALATSAVGVGLTLVPSLPVVILGLAMAACGVFVGQAAATSLLGVLAGDRRALAAGLYLACYYAGGSAGGVLPALAWAAGGWPACAGLVAATAVATALLMRLTWPARARMSR